MSNARIYKAQEAARFQTWQVGGLVSSDTAEAPNAGRITPSQLRRLVRDDSHSTAAERTPPTEAELLAREQALLEREHALNLKEKQTLEKAHQQGLEQASEEAWKSAALERQMLARMAETLGEDIETLNKVLADRILGLSVRIARQVLMDNVDIHTDSVLHVLNEAIESLGLALDKLNLHAHPDTIEVLAKQFGDSAQFSGIRLVPDLRMLPGGFHLNHPEGEMDCSLETRWKRVMETLGVKDPLKPKATEDH